MFLFSIVNLEAVEANIMSAYLVLQTNIMDYDVYEGLIDEMAPIFGAFKAHVLVADNDTKMLEGEHGFKRTVIVEFDSLENLEAWHKYVKEIGLADRAMNVSSSYLLSYAQSAAKL